MRVCSPSPLAGLLLLWAVLPAGGVDRGRLVRSEHQRIVHSPGDSELPQSPPEAMVTRVAVDAEGRLARQMPAVPSEAAPVAGQVPPPVQGIPQQAPVQQAPVQQAPVQQVVPVPVPVPVPMQVPAVAAQPPAVVPQPVPVVPVAAPGQAPLVPMPAPLSTAPLPQYPAAAGPAAVPVAGIPPVVSEGVPQVPGSAPNASGSMPAGLAPASVAAANATERVEEEKTPTSHPALRIGFGVLLSVAVVAGAVYVWRGQQRQKPALPGRLKQGQANLWARPSGSPVTRQTYRASVLAATSRREKSSSGEDASGQTPSRSRRSEAPPKLEVPPKPDRHSSQEPGAEPPPAAGLAAPHAGSPSRPSRSRDRATEPSSPGAQDRGVAEPATAALPPALDDARAPRAGSGGSYRDTRRRLLQSQQSVSAAPEQRQSESGA